MSIREQEAILKNYTVLLHIYENWVEVPLSACQLPTWFECRICCMSIWCFIHIN